jgi:uncharacterized membrane protein YphA (DoxX/SURF4 family)
MAGGSAIPLGEARVNAIIPPPPWLLALARVVLGASFLFSDHGAGAPGELAGFFGFAMRSSFPWYRPVLQALIIPHADVIGPLVVVAEIAIGIALIAGIATRFVACGAIVLLVNYECAKGSPPWRPGIDQSEIVIALIVLVCAAGRAYGVDALLYGRFRKVPL